MKKTIIWFLIIIWLISIFYYENRYLILSNNLNNVAIWEYNSGSYNRSLEVFSWAVILNTDSIIQYNLGNSLYKLTELKVNNEVKISWFTQVLEIYSGSLALKYNQDTQDNYEYVENKLYKLINPEENNQNNSQENNKNNTEETQEWNSQESWSEESSEETNQDSNPEDKNTSSQSSQNDQWDKNPEWWESQDSEQDIDSSKESKSEETWEEWESQWSDENNNWNDLSQEELQQIENYANQLKKQEYYNQRHFNKQEPEQSNDIDGFFQDSFFDDSFIRGGEKDW